MQIKFIRKEVDHAYLYALCTPKIYDQVLYPYCIYFYNWFVAWNMRQVYLS